MRGADHAAVLTRALALCAAGRVPLVLDERVAPEAAAGQVDAAAHALEDLAARSSERAAQVAWAAATSGSTGTPRVVLRTDRSWSVGHAHVRAWLGLEPGEGLLVPVHPTSSMALNAAAFCAATGARLLVPARARVRAEDLAAAPHAPAPAALHGTPAQLADVLDLLDDAAPAPALRVALVGGDRLPAGLRARAEAHGLRLVHYYGAAEASFVAVDPDGTGLCLLPGVEAETEDGLLLVRSDQLAEPDGSSLHLTGPDGAATALPRWRPDGFLRTGDAAALDSDRLTLHGRADGVILTAGATVHASAVEEVFAGVRDDAGPLASAVLVAGEADARLGRRVVAWVEPAPGRDPEDVLAALRTAARDRLTSAARPRRWHAVDRLPRTPSGKVRRVPPGSVMDSGA
ncbi:long-chain fatty acid--CoA ligase [Micrococcus flavus]|nr:long-chain fatty acid--CoA ligase [Micrococcus flavus]